MRDSMTESGREFLNSLTTRERALVAEFCRSGAKNRELGRRLGNTEWTIKNRFRTIYEKAGVRKRIQLLQFCAVTGIVALMAKGAQ